MRQSDGATHQHSRIPLTVIAGAPRAGKSTLVRHLLEHSTGRRVAAIVSDVRVLGPSVVRGHDDGRCVLRNGCLGVVAEDPAPALAALARQPERPEHVLVDGEGWADPRRLAGYGYMPGYHLDGTVVVLDAPGLHPTVGDPKVEGRLTEQIRMADVIVLNKVDLIGDREADGAHALLERLSPRTRIVWSDHARIAPPLLLGLPEGAALDGLGVTAAWSPQFAPPWQRPRGGRARQAERHRGWCLTRAEPIDAREFREWVHRLQPSILHGRGTVHLREEPQHRHTFHLFGSHWHLERGAPWGTDVPWTRLLLAGFGGSPRTPVSARVATLGEPAVFHDGEPV